MRITAAVIDDDQRDLRKIENTFDSISEELDIRFYIRSYSRVEDILTCDADWYIIDIDLSREEDGFSAAKRIHSVYPDAKIIFCTSHPELVFNSFETDVFYFVRKDHLKDDLFKAAAKYIRSTARSQHYIHTVNKNIVPIPWNSILYFENSGNNIYIKTKNNHEYKERKTLPALLNDLPESTFLQISRTFIVNMNEIIRFEEKEVILSNGKSLPVVRERRKEARQNYMKFMTWR